MSYKLFPTGVTPRLAAEMLRKQLGGGGYHVFDVAKRFCTTSDDFVAVKKDDLNNFVVVRARRLPVQALPFGLTDNALPARTIIKSLRYYGNPVARIGPQIDLRRMNLRLEHFIPPHQHKEFERVFPGITLAA